MTTSEIYQKYRTMFKQAKSLQEFEDIAKDPIFKGDMRKLKASPDKTAYLWLRHAYDYYRKRHNG